MAEENININIRYEATGVDSSIRETQRLLYAMNAVRLSIRDIQEVMAGPTVQNVMWTAIQLTRVWTSLYRLVNATNRAQRTGVGQGVMGAAAGRGGAFAAGQVTLGGGQVNPGLLATLIAFAQANPLITGAVAAATFTTAAVLWKKNEEDRHQEWIRKQRETAKTQGLEP